MIACVLKSGGIYRPEHVRALAEQCRRWAPFQPFVCLSDVPVADVEVRPLTRGWRGWWSKLELFRPEVFKAGTRVLYLDLDTVILGPLEAMLDRAEPLLALADFYRRPPRQFRRGLGSGLLMWTAGEQDALFDEFDSAPDAHMRRCGFGGDQRFIEERRLNEVTFWEDVVPGQVVSYKVHCRSGVPDGASVVCFHGTPKPWDVTLQMAEAVCQ